MKKSKHQIIVDGLERLLNKAMSINKVDTNLLYPTQINNLGEIDVLAYQYNTIIYYEVKSNHHYKAFKKAKEQLMRWSRYYTGQTQYNTLGVYYTPQKGSIPVCKNGIWLI